MMHQPAQTGGRRTRALSLLSGGLDSQLAVALLREQGVEVECIAFDSPFFCVEPALRAARSLGVRLHRLDFTGEMVALLENPPHGFGTCLNPCLDCHARMIARAGDLMEAGGFDLIATGEVLNQRPMSQTRRGLALVARLSGYAEYLLRPLSARHLPETRPEREGWVERSRLLSFEGRNRKPQMALAEHYGIRDYPSPAGGCRLTEPNYCRRLRDLMAHEGLQRERLLHLLRLGRHLRLPGGGKLIVGRDQADNVAIRNAATSRDLRIEPRGCPGPIALIPEGAAAPPERVSLAIRVAAAYMNRRSGPIEFELIRSSGVEHRLAPEPPLNRNTINAWLV